MPSMDCLKDAVRKDQRKDSSKKSSPAQACPQGVLHLYQDLLRLHGLFQGHFWRSFKKAMDPSWNLTPPQALVLCHLRAQSPSTADPRPIRSSHLLYACFYPGTNPSYITQKLVQQSYLCRQVDPQDRRVFWLTLTLQGHQVAQACHQNLRAQLGSGPLLTQALEDTLQSLQTLLALLPG